MSRVLIVDDEAEVAKALKRVLRRHHEVETVSDPALAAEVFDRFVPDVLICDVRMPGVSGDVLCTELRRSRPEVVGFLMSGDADVEVACRADPQLGFFGKPWDNDAVISAIADALARRG